MPNKYNYKELISLAEKLFLKAGLEDEMAQITAKRLVEGDMMGHTTHGLALCAPYLKEIAAGNMNKSGTPTEVVDKGSTIVWDGDYLPGLWIVYKAIELAKERVKEYGVVSFSIRKSTHIACLQTLLKQATDDGYMIIIASSDPSVASVAPYGGIRPLFTPNPIAIGMPTVHDPILIDISASITTNGYTMRKLKAGEKMPGQWLQDHQGNATDDPAVFAATPPGSVLPIGGHEYGHKGFGLALMIELLTQGLSGLGRDDKPTKWGASLFIQLIDPDAFAGKERFQQIASYLANICRESPPIPGSEGVRMPGERGLKRMRKAMTEGTELFAGIIESIRPWAEKYEIDIPEPMIE